MNEKVFYVHVNNHAQRPSLRGMTAKERKNLKPSYTVAGILDEKAGTFRIGIAQCSKHDAFVKAIGRAKASGRAISADGYVVQIPSEVLTTKKVGKFFVDEAKKLIA